MKKYTFKQVKERRQILASITCNCCGDEISQIDGFGFEDHYSGAYTGGYNSRILGDMNHYEFDICEFCLDKIFKTFKIDPYTGNGDGEVID